MTSSGVISIRPIGILSVSAIDRSFRFSRSQSSQPAPRVNDDNCQTVVRFISWLLCSTV